MDEIWKLPTMIKICLIKHIRIVADKIIDSQLEKFKVESLIERIIFDKAVQLQKFREYRNINLNGKILSYIEHLIYSLKKLGADGEKYLKILEDEIIKSGTTTSEIVKIEHYDLAVRRISMSNSILSIKNISKFDWSMLFEKINNIESFLMRDEVYQKMDFVTRNMYRNEIKKLAEKAKVSEFYVANKLIEVSIKENKHIGFFLFDEEKDILYKELEYMSRKKEIKNNKKLVEYIISIYLPVLLLCIAIMKEYFWIGILPFSEVFVNLINKFIMKIKKPKLLPRMEVIDDEINTFVIVPTLLNSKERGKKLIQDLEVYYLANRDTKLYFCLLGDATEIDSKNATYDEDIKNTGIEEVKKLNEKYENEIFHFIYRERVFNKSFSFNR